MHLSVSSFFALLAGLSSVSAAACDQPIAWIGNIARNGNGKDLEGYYTMTLQKGPMTCSGNGVWSYGGFVQGTGTVTGNGNNQNTADPTVEQLQTVEPNYDFRCDVPNNDVFIWKFTEFQYVLVTDRVTNWLYKIPIPDRLNNKASDLCPYAVTPVKKTA